MPKSITEQIEDLQNENLRLKEFEKLFDKAVKNVFGIDSKSIVKKLSKGTEKPSEFERRICNYFGINTDEEKTEFLEILCSDSSLRYFNEICTSDTAGIGEQKATAFLLP